MREKQAARHWRLILHLNSLRVGATVEELAQLLGCATRTVYRDLDALMEGGFPIVAQKSGDATSYSFVEGYKTRLSVVFSPMELMALSVAGQACNFLDGTVLHDALESAKKKMAATLDEKHKQYAETIQDNFRVCFRPVHNYAKFHVVIEAVTKSIMDKKALKISYWSAGTREKSERIIEPYRLWFVNSAFYVVAFCRMRKDVRTFMIDRIKTWEKTEIAYEIPDSFDFDEFQSRGFKVLGGEREHEVVVRVHPLLRPQMTEQTWHPTQQIEELEDGWLRVKFRLAALDEVKTWIMGYAPYIVVERPVELRDDVCRAYKESLR